MRCSRRGIFGISSSGNLLLKSKFFSLFRNFGNEYQSRSHKQGFSKRSRVLWALFQHCSCVTSPRAGVSLPGPPLNISHCRSLPGSLSLSLSLSQRKGTIINCALPRRPTSPLPSLSSSLFLYLYLSLALPLCSHPHSFIFFSPNLWALSVRISATTFCLLPSQSGNGSERCM